MALLKSYDAVPGLLKDIGNAVIAVESTVPLDVPAVGNWRNVDLDLSGRIVKAVARDGTEYVARLGLLVATNVSGPHASTDYTFEYLTSSKILTNAIAVTPLIDYMIIVDGQSWAQGQNGDTADLAISTTPLHPGKGLMFSSGPRPGGGAVTTLVDLAEVGKPETICSMADDVIMTRLNARFGTKPRIIWAVSAHGGTAYDGGAKSAIDGLMRGSVQYAELLRLVRAANDITTAAGRRLVVIAHARVHGEEDWSTGTARDLYLRGLMQTVLDINADVPAITGQVEPIRMFVNQVGYGADAAGVDDQIALAQLDAGDDKQIVCIGPTYFAPMASGDTGHLANAGYVLLGRLYGHNICEHVFGPYVKPLKVVDSWWQSSTVIRLKWSMPIAIETDDSKITISTLGAGKGLDFTDGTGSPPAISSIGIVSGTTDTMDVTLAAAPTGLNPRLHISMRRTAPGVGPIVGARTGIRTSAILVPTDGTHPDQYTWAAKQLLTL